MKKLVVSICAAFVMVGSVFFLVQEGVVRLPNGMVRDVIGPALDERHAEQARVLLNRMIRRLSIESRKIDYLVRQVEDGLPELAEGEGADAGVLRDFVSTHPSCSRVRLVDRELRIRFSTSENDVVGARVDEQVYRPVFVEQPAAESRVLVDTLIGKLVIHRRIDPYGLLFYFDQEVLDPAFSGAGGLQYSGFVVTADRTLLVNFPEIKAADETNMARLVRAMRADRSGALRVKLNGRDKTVYYTAGEDQYADWVVGVTLDIGSVRVSPVSAVVLVIQACVVTALVLFLIAAFRRGEQVPSGGRAPEGRAGEEKAPAKSVARGEEGAGEAAHGEPVGAADLEPGEAHAGVVPSAETPPGVVTLDELEEVEDIEDVGEAEIAEEIEELEPLDEEEEEEEEIEEEDGEPGGKAGETRYEAAGEQPPRPGRGETRLSRAESGAEEEQESGAGDEPIENDRIDFESYDRATSGNLPGLDKLLDMSTEWSGGEGGPLLSDQEEAAAEVPAPPEEAPEASGAGEAGEPGEEAVLSAVPEGTRRSAGSTPDDELARLIHLIEESDRPGTPASGPLEQAPARPPLGPGVGRAGAKAAEEFHRFMDRLGLSKGALLVESGGSYLPAVTLGLGGNTAGRLRLDAGEGVVRNILMRDRILYVRDDAFMSRIMRAKFDLRDSSTVKRLFFAPVFDRRRDPPLAAILMICLTTGEAVAEHSRSEEILKEIKKLKRQLPNILQ
jgi:hypothetical protein